MPIVSSRFVGISVRISVFYGGSNGDVFDEEVDGLDLLASYCEEKIRGWLLRFHKSIQQ